MNVCDNPVENRVQLVERLEGGAKEKAFWRIGTEHEKIPFHLKTYQPVPYEGEGGIESVLKEFQARFSWSPVFEGEILTGLQRDGASVSLEPGGQFELSGAPLQTVHETCREVSAHLREARGVGDSLGLGFLSLGFQPKWPLESIPVMPKPRYQIMRAYMPKVGRLGHQMMLRSATVQTNLDFSDEADMRKKFRVALALQPIATALFANSPFAEGRPNGFLSYRSYVWGDTDPDRTGMLPFVFEDGFGFERYVDYALDVPMYFIRRDGHYLDTAGASFRDFLEGRLPQRPGEKPTLSDWDDHLSTLFPEVRLKTFLEMRGADAGRWNRLCALPAFWVGLLYDSAVLEAAWSLVKDWTWEEREALRRGVPVLALKTPFRGRYVQDLAREVLALSRDGLKNRACLNDQGRDEQVFLDDLEVMVEKGETAAEVLLDCYHRTWKGRIDPVFKHCAY